jgi:CheY-like chemotaxis protein
MPINMLYVDDDDCMRAIVETACQLDPEFVVTTVPSGQEALSLAQQQPFDLILLDVVMPGLDGPATLALLRAQEEGPPAPIAFLTAHAHPTEVDWLQSRDVVGVLAKPFDPRTLTQLLRSLVEDGSHPARHN